MKGFLFAPPAARHPMWAPRLGQTTVVTTTTTTGNGTVQAAQATPPGKIDLLTLVVVGGAVLVVTEATGLTHVRKWFTKTLGLSRSS